MQSGLRHKSGNVDQGVQGDRPLGRFLVGHPFDVPLEGGDETETLEQKGLEHPLVLLGDHLQLGMFERLQAAVNSLMGRLQVPLGQWVDVQGGHPVRVSIIYIKDSVVVPFVRILDQAAVESVILLPFDAIKLANLKKRRRNRDFKEKLSGNQDEP